MKWVRGEFRTKRQLLPIDPFTWEEEWGWVSDDGLWGIYEISSHPRTMSEQSHYCLVSLPSGAGVWFSTLKAAKRAAKVVTPILDWAKVKTVKQVEAILKNEVYREQVVPRMRKLGAYGDPSRP